MGKLLGPVPAVSVWYTPFAFSKYVCVRIPRKASPACTAKPVTISAAVPIILSFRRSSQRCGTHIQATKYNDAVDDYHPNFVDGNQQFVVVNFYHIVTIDDPENEVAKHRLFLQDKNIHGRIYISHHGINAQYSGPSVEALSYADWVKEDCKFKDVLVKIQRFTGHAFPRLKLQHRQSLVQFEGGISHLSLSDASLRAVPLSPSEWKNKLISMSDFDAKSGDGSSGVDSRKSILLLDVRNGYEWDIGHFQGAQRPLSDCFRQATLHIESSKNPLSRADKRSTEILMYCTGGIRCDVYSVILRQMGFIKLYTLRGGIENYLKEEGLYKWVGNLFVFDSRLSVSPTVYNPACTPCLPENAASFKETVTDKWYLHSLQNAFGRCDLCRSQLSRLRHRNCANLDCNQLILLCTTCIVKYKGCCSMVCLNAPRRRPLLGDDRPYARWHNYHDRMK